MATYYISPSGNDTTGNGSLATPWQTISKAISSSTAGDTINLAAGSYTWPSSLTSLNDRTIIGASAFTTTVTSSGGSVAGFRVYGTVVIRNIRFTNTVKTATGNTGLFYNDQSVQPMTLTIEDCIFDNLVWNSSNAGGMFLIVYSTLATQVININRCLFYGNTCSALNSEATFWIANGASTTLNLANCTFYSTKAGSNSVTFLGHQPSAGGNANFTIKNCIFMDSSGTNPPIVRYLSAAPNYVNCTNNIAYGLSSVPAWTNHLSSDPLFVDAANANFSLRPTSPAIDAGVLI